MCECGGRRAQEENETIAYFHIYSTRTTKCVVDVEAPLKLTLPVSWEKRSKKDTQALVQCECVLCTYVALHQIHSYKLQAHSLASQQRTVADVVFVLFSDFIFQNEWTEIQTPCLMCARPHVCMRSWVAASESVDCEVSATWNLVIDSIGSNAEICSAYVQGEWVPKKKEEREK